VSRLLAKLVALANRPGTPSEGAAARTHAERLAARDGQTVVEATSGELIAIDAFHAELLDRLRDIADGRTHGGELSKGGS
jgi:hypothetical protein